jgi:hypothetical protein
VKTPHLLRVDQGPDRFALLIDAARTLGLRIGWLDLGAAPAPPADLESAASLGVLRAVAVGEGRAVAVKPLRGAPVLRDLLREHFQGCALVLVRGPVDAPPLAPDGEGWRVEPSGVAALRYSSEQLATALRKPHPWQSAAG